MKNSKELKKYKGNMKRNKTKHEKFLYDFFTMRKMEFKTQVILGFYILDFVLLPQLLVIEVDGSTHKKKYDDARDAFIRKCGLNVQHIKNEDLNWNVLDHIDKYALTYQDYTKNFRSALARANNYRSVAIRKLRESDTGNHSSPHLAVRRVKRDNMPDLVQTHSDASSI